MAKRKSPCGERRKAVASDTAAGNRNHECGKQVKSPFLV